MDGKNDACGNKKLDNMGYRELFFIHFLVNFKYYLKINLYIFKFFF